MRAAVRAALSAKSTARASVNIPLRLCRLHPASLHLLHLHHHHLHPLLRPPRLLCHPVANLQRANPANPTQPAEAPSTSAYCTGPATSCPSLTVSNWGAEPTTVCMSKMAASSKSTVGQSRRLFMRHLHGRDITFKVCKDPTNCFSGPVEAKDRFYLQDQLGDIRDAKGAPGFVSSSSLFARRRKFLTSARRCGSYVHTHSPYSAKALIECSFRAKDVVVIA